MKVVSLTCGLFLVIALVFTLVTFIGCSQDSSPSLTASSPPKPAVASAVSPSPARVSGPAVQITSPENSATQDMGSITIVTKVDDFKITSNSGQANISGQGHIHFYMDVEPPTAPDQPAVTAPGTYIEGSNTSCVWKNVGAGTHKFSVQLVNNDHTPLNPPATSFVSLRVIAGKGMPVLIIGSPREGEVVSGDSVTINAQVANYNLVDKTGQAPAPNEGHLMFYKDVEAPTIQGPQATTLPGTFVAVAGASYTWQNITPGIHTFSVQLVANNNTPINPPVSAKITISVK
jgi:hypothetical protein